MAGRGRTVISNHKKTWSAVIYKLSTSKVKNIYLYSTAKKMLRIMYTILVLCACHLIL